MPWRHNSHDKKYFYTLTTYKLVSSFTPYKRLYQYWMRWYICCHSVCWCSYPPVLAHFLTANWIIKHLRAQGQIKNRLDDRWWAKARGAEHAGTGEGVMSHTKDPSQWIWLNIRTALVYTNRSIWNRQSLFNCACRMVVSIVRTLFRGVVWLITTTMM